MAKDSMLTGYDSEVMPLPAHRSELKRVLRAFFRRKIAVFGVAVIVLLIFVALFAPLIAPYDPNKMDFGQILKGPSAEHLLGTDPLGRDTLSRIIFGSRTSLTVGLGAVGLAAVVGGALGLIAAYFGGILFSVIMRLADALMAIPMLLTALIISAVLGGGVKNVIIALGIGMVPVTCRMMCGQALTVKQNEYVLAGKSMGMSDLRQMLIHILPNAFPPLLVVVTIGLGTTILSEAGLSFLGLGVLPPASAWGSMINDGYKYLLTNPILSFAPGLAIMLTVFGFNMMGDGLRDALDPKLRGLV